MTTIDASTPVGDIVLENPRAATTFYIHGIDFCSAGKTRLADVCAEKGLQTEALLRALQRATIENTPESSFDSGDADEIIRHIVDRYHADLNAELPVLEFLSKKVARVHGADRPELVGVRESYLALQEDLVPHMMKEEQILFPLIRRLAQCAQSGEDPGPIHCGSVRNPISRMEFEHREVGALLEKLHALTGGYAPPADACTSYRALYAGLQKLESDLYHHIQLENNVLHPLAADLESRARR